MDDLTPMEPAEILEVYTPAEQKPEEVGYYGTCSVHRKNRHWGMMIFAGFVAASMLGVIAFLNFYEIRVERSDGGYGMYLIRRGAKPTQPTQQNIAEMPSLSVNDALSSSTEMSLQSIYQKTAPSVVAVATAEGVTSGVIIDESGYIVTTYRAVDKVGKIEVELYDDSCYDAVFVAGDEVCDLAVLKIDATDLTPAEFGDSELLQVGDSTVAIGNPLGAALKGTMTDGIISAINRDLDYNGTKLTLLQTNAVLSDGNAGGPLINSYGQVIGIHTTKFHSADGIGIAIPSETVKLVVKELMTSGYVSGRPTLGIKVSDLSSLQRNYFNLPEGVFITEIDLTSQAYLVGLRYGDIVLMINDTPITSTSVWNSKLAALPIGETATLTIYRYGFCRQVDIPVEEQK